MSGCDHRASKKRVTRDDLLEWSSNTVGSSTAVGMDSSIAMSCGTASKGVEPIFPWAVCNPSRLAHLAKASEDVASVRDHALAKLSRVNPAFAQLSTERELVAPLSLEQHPSFVHLGIPSLAPAEREGQLGGDVGCETA